MKLVSSKQMQELDRLAIEKHGIAALLLMERAGLSLANAAAKVAKKGQIFVVCGKGNNGGDGLVAARYLISMGFEIGVVILGSASELTPCSRANFELLANLTVKIYQTSSAAELSSLIPAMSKSSCLIDAVLGTGLVNVVSGVAASAIDKMNSLRIPIVSADIPSGLSSDSGKALGRCVHAARTVTFGLPKVGLFVGDGPQYCGKIDVVDIGIPEKEVAALETSFEMIEPSMFPKLFEVRSPVSPKGNFGHAAIFACSRAHLGAGYLASLAALRAGCGLVTLALPEKAFAKFDPRYAEIMCEALPDDGMAAFTRSSLNDALKIAQGKDAIAIGPAIGTLPQTAEFVNEFVKQTKNTLVIDADGLNVLSLDSLKGRRDATILTPHPKEMSRLCNTNTEAVQADRERIASTFAKLHKCVVVLKGKNTIVADEHGRVLINPSGNAGMATAGMGDALTGIITSFLAQGMSPLDAAASGAMIHGVAGDIALAEQGERALITSDVIRSLGAAFINAYGAA